MTRLSFSHRGSPRFQHVSRDLGVVFAVAKALGQRHLTAQLRTVHGGA